MSRADERYRLATTLWKSILTFLVATFGVGGTVLAVSLPESYAQFRELWPTLILPLVLGLIKALDNYRKNRSADGSPLWVWWPWSHPPQPP